MTASRARKLITQCVVFLWILSLAACGNQIKETEQTTEPTPTPTVNPSEPPDQASIDWFLALFPEKIQTTLHYDDDMGTARYLTLSNVEFNIASKVTRYHFEGETAEAMPQLLYEAYDVGENGVYQVIGEEKLPLLKTKLAVDATWDGMWYDVGYGLMHVNFILTAVSDQSVTVQIVPIPDVNIDLADNWSVTLTLEKGKGIVRTVKSTHSGSSNQPLQSKLLTVSSVPPATFASRYVQPSQALAQLSVDPFFQIGMQIKLSQWQKSNPNADDAAKMAFLDQLFAPWVDAKQSPLDLPIATAKEMVMQLASGMTDPDLLIQWFVDFYEAYISNRYDLVEQLDPNGAQWLESLFSWDDTSFQLQYKPLKNIFDAQERAVSILLQQNGFQLTYSEGWGYFTTKAGYTLDLAALGSPAMAKWLELQDWEVRHYPLADDGGLFVSYKDLIDYIIQLEQYEATYPKSAYTDIIKSKIQFYMETLVVPTDFFPNTPLYENGRLNDEANEAYAYAAKTYPKSKSAHTLQEALGYLNQSNRHFTAELYQYLLKQGFSNFSEIVAKAAQQETLQREDLSKLSALPASPPSESPGSMVTITVDSAESLLKAIGSNRYIKLKPGDYTLPYNWTGNSVNIVEGECTIGNVKNLVIIGDDKAPVTIRSEAYGYLLVFNECSNIRLENVRLGHLQEFCKGGVIGLRYCDGVVIEHSILYGCGYWGLDALNTKNISINRTVISDCETRALELVNTEVVRITNSIMSRNGKTVVMMDNSQHVVFENLLVDNNKGETDPTTVGALFHLIGSENVIGRNIRVNGNANTKLQLADGEAMKIQ